MHREAKASRSYEQGKNIFTAVGKAFWNLLELDNYVKALGLDSLPEVPEVAEKDKKEERPFYGLRSWSHWFVFVFLYLPTLLLYGVAAKREEVAAWAERRLEDRKRRIRQTGQTEGATQSRSPSLGLFVIEFLAVVLGTVAASRIVRWMNRRKFDV